MNLKAKLRLGILIVLVVIASLLFLGAAGFSVLSGLRAYVGAEGLWTKGQQEATYQLARYVISQDEVHYRTFRHSLTVPLGDFTARLEMDSPDFRYDIAKQGFITGGNHPDDTRAMIYLYRIFKNFSHVKLAIEQWALGDKGIAEISALGQEIHTAAADSVFDLPTQEYFIGRIDQLQEELSAAETKFSYHMAIASRIASQGLIVIMVVFSVVGGVICFFVLRGIQNLLDELSSSEDRFRRLAENAPDVIYRMALPSGQYEYMSPAGETVFGYTPEKFYSEPQLIARIIHQDWRDFFSTAWRNLLAGDMPPTYEYKINHPTRGERWLNQRNVLTRNEAGQPIAIEGVVTDITQHKDLEEERERLATELWHAHKMEAIGTLAGGIAHDFNNVLYSIMGNAEMARMDIEDGSPPAKCLDELLVASARARDLVQRILAFSRHDKQEHILVDVVDIVSETIRLLEATLPATVEIIQNLPPTEPTVLADPTQLHQIVMNLGTNAAQALEPNGGRIKISLNEVDISSEDSGELPLGLAGRFVQLEVCDNGPGIDPEFIEKVFDPYFTTKPAGKGTGMGLAVVHGIVKNHGGAVMVENAPEGGSVFRVFLPLVDADHELTVEEETPITTGTERILLVDDEPSLVLLNEIQLSRRGYQVTTATSGPQALEFFRTDPDRIDLVVTDQTMPGMTGDELAQELLKIRPGLPIVLCTGYSQTVTAESASEIGIKAFLMKPITGDELAKSIRDNLDS